MSENFQDGQNTFHIIPITHTGDAGPQGEENILCTKTQEYNTYTVCICPILAC